MTLVVGSMADCTVAPVLVRLTTNDPLFPATGSPCEWLPEMSGCPTYRQRGEAKGGDACAVMGHSHRTAIQVGQSKDRQAVRASDMVRKRQPGAGVTLGRVRTLLAVEESSDEQAWWTSAANGRGEAFAQIFDLHRDRVYRHALRLNGNVHDAEDVTAGAFLKLWRRRTDVRLVEGSVLPWLLVTTTNLSRNTARSLRRYRALIDSLPRSTAARSAGEIALEQLEEAKAAEQVRAALRSLSKTDAALIALTAFEGCTPAEAGTALGISDGAARTRLHRARTRIASALSAATAASLPTTAKDAKEQNR